jgi:hypothetical protein
MIDTQSEEMLTLGEAAKRLPGRSGKRQSIQTMYRWAYKGVRRNDTWVKLESVLIGCSRYTSVEALQRFVERCNETPEPCETVSLPRSPNKRGKAAERAKAELRKRQKGIRLAE